MGIGEGSDYSTCDERRSPARHSLSPRLAATATERDRTRSERVQYAYNGTRLAMLLVAPVVAVIWLFIRDEVDQARIARWCIALAIAYAARLLVGVLHARSGPSRDPRTERLWTVAFHASIAASGFAWSLLVWDVLDDAEPALRLSGVAVLIAMPCLPVPCSRQWRFLPLPPEKSPA